MKDSQKLEFLPNFLSGKAYEVVQRVSGCSYDSVLRILHERYGQPAAVAAACIESLTKGPKLHNNDYTGLLNFAELGRSFIQHSGKGRNPTAVRSFKVCQASGGN